MEESKRHIGFTKVSLPFGWLGNMAPYPVVYDLGHGLTNWRTTEALFQAMRFPEHSPVRKRIYDEKSPMGAKFVAKAHRPEMIVDPMSTADVLNMRLCLELKTRQHDLMKDLLATGDSVLYEDVASRKNKGSSLFWGAYLDGDQLVGRNMLGHLWMEIRNSAV